MSIKNTLKKIIKESLKSTYEIDLNTISIKYKESNIYSFDVSLLANILNKSPTNITNIIISNIPKNEIIDNINTINQETINFSIKKEYLLSNINTILEKKRRFGRSNYGNNQKINIGFTDNNFNKKLNINSIKNLIYIDNLSRIMSFCGYDVTKEYYLSNPNEDNIFLETIEEELDIYRIKINKYTTSQSLYENNIIDKVLTDLRYTNYCYLKDNNLYLKTTDFKTKDDIILVYNDGTYSNFTYILSQYINKINKCYKKIIDIVPSNNQIYQEELISALNILSINSNILEIKKSQMTRLIKDNNKISEDNIEPNYILNTIGINNIRYILSLSKIDNSIDLDINFALIKNNNNPIYYIEKSYIEICSIIKKYKNIITKVDKYINLDSNLTYNILNKLYEFEDVVIASSETKEPNLISDYIYNLIILFNSFLEKKPIIDNNKECINEKLNLLLAIKIVINNALNLIGIIPKEEF